MGTEALDDVGTDMQGRRGLLTTARCQSKKPERGTAPRHFRPHGRPLQLWKRAFVLLSVTTFVVTCDGSPGKWPTRRSASTFTWSRSSHPLPGNPMPQAGHRRGVLSPVWF